MRRRHCEETRRHLRVHSRSKLCVNTKLWLATNDVVVAEVNAMVNARDVHGTPHMYALYRRTVQALPPEFTWHCEYPTVLLNAVIE